MSEYVNKLIKKCPGKNEPNKRAKLEFQCPTNEEEDFKPSKSQRRSKVRTIRSQKHSNMQRNTWKEMGLDSDVMEARRDRACFKGQSVNNENGVALRYCPICQFPFRNLVGQSEEWHVSDCLVSRGNTPSLGECPKGIDCVSISQEHYRRYLHTEQAKHRSNYVEPVIDSSTSGVTAQGDGYECSSQLIRSKCETAARSCLDSIDSTMSPDDSYEKLLSEIVDELENDEVIKIDCDSCQHDDVDTACVVSGPCVSTVGECRRNGTNKSPNLAGPNVSFELCAEKTLNNKPLTASFPDTSSSPSKKKITEERKLQQTNLSSYFGMKGEKKEASRNVEENIQLNTPTNNPSEWDEKTLNNHEINGKVEQYKKAKTCPFYKKIPDTSITVDAFSYGSIPGCTAYFLSHFHYDHYGGLNKAFCSDIYCSKVTASLISMQIKVNSKFIHSLPLNQEVLVGDVKVILLDANHCPGSVMFLFLLPNGKTILHTGDFRAVSSMGEYQHLQNVSIDTVYLDTTYCNPSYNFPTQQSTIDFAVEKSCSAVQLKPRTLIVCGSYSVGKERVFVSIANALDCKICANAGKRRILNCLDWPELTDRLTTKWNLAQVHVLSMNQINVKALKSHLLAHSEFNEVLAFKPTGWTFKESFKDLKRIRPTISGSVSIYGIPYSEHSSFSELEWFVRRFRPRRIIPTVNNGSYASRNRMQRTFNEWLSVKM